MVKILHSINLEQELHMVGELVAVAFNVTDSKREGEPYIDFPLIYEESDDGTCYVDEDQSITVGLDVEQARQLAEELPRAIAYIENREWEKV